MLNELKSLLGVKVLTKEEQKMLKGGGPCCDPITQCCIVPQVCINTLCVQQGGTCNCSSGCAYCFSDYLYCGCV